MTYTNDPVAELEGLTKSYGKHRVLDHVDLSVQPGIHALLGRNGAGKTTLISILCTLVQPSAGAARVLGHDVVREAKDVRAAIGLTGQLTAVDEPLSGADNLVLMGRLLGLSGRAARARAAELGTQFGLDDALARPVRAYSGGMRRRLDLAVSMIRPPRLLFLDEPTTGLDPQGRSLLWSQIRQLADEGTSVLLTTQYLEEADALAEAISVLHDGRIVQQGTPAELKTAAGPEVLEVRDQADILLQERPVDGSAADLARVSAEVAERYPDAILRLRRPTLDDAFEALTGGAARSAQEVAR